VRRWWWASGAITLAVSTLNEGGDDEGEGKRQGRRPLRGGEGVDGEAARRGGTPARDGIDGLLEEGEGKGAGVGRAGREAEAQEEWGWLGRLGRLGQKGGPGRFGCSAKTKKQILSEF
jgi:hypothetical protein